MLLSVGLGFPSVGIQIPWFAKRFLWLKNLRLPFTAMSLIRWELHNIG